MVLNAQRKGNRAHEAWELGQGCGAGTGEQGENRVWDVGFECQLQEVDAEIGLHGWSYYRDWGEQWELG